MSEHRAVIEWERRGAFDEEYDRAHEWRFDGGVVVPASSAPHLRGDPSRVDPEEAFVAAISSCHMLWFLHLAAGAGFTVDRYRDEAVGVMARDESGRTWITHVDLHTDITWSGAPPATDEVDALHQEAHHRCFIANSVRTVITVRGAR